MSAAAENVIGGILIGGKDAYWRVADLLRPEDFPSASLSRLYEVCAEIAESSAELDVFTVGDESEARGGMPTSDVIGIAAVTISAANIRGHAELVKADAIERRFRAICAEGAKTGDMTDVQAKISGLLDAQPAGAVSVHNAMKRMWQGVMARYEAGDDLAGISTGYPKLDEMTGGLQPGRVYGIAGRTKMGKSVLTMNIAANVALAGKHVMVFSLEMGDEELMQRMACAASGIPSAVLQRPRLMDTMEDSTPRLFAAIKRLQETSMRVCDRTDIAIEEIEAQARQQHASGMLDLLVIDHIGLLKMPKLDRQDLKVAHCTRRIKIIAKELHIPVIPVIQLNRGSESSSVVRFPRPSDARDSGAIEQDLDAMLLLHRPSYYDKRAEKGLRLDLALQRNGPTGLIRMEDELHCCRFTGGADEWTDSSAPNASDDL